MIWNPGEALRDFREVARLAGTELPTSAIDVEILAAPHLPPSKLPHGKMAVYVFSTGSGVLKVGKVGANSQARYVSQHYNPGSAMSTLAASILADQGFSGQIANPAMIGRWIKDNVDRVNLLIDASIGMPIVALLEAFLHCRLKPRYEGFKGQRL